MIHLSFQRTMPIPLYRQLADQLREYIRSGALPAGARLPTVRELAQTHNLTRLTVHSAYMELQAEGLVEAIVGRGTFISTTLPIATGPGLSSAVRVQPPPDWLSQGVMADMMRMVDEKNFISFAQVAPPPEAYPSVEFTRSLRVAMEDPATQGYASPQGLETLRQQIAHLLLDRGIVTHPANILIVSGAQQGIDLTLRTFSQPDDVVLVEEPTYVGLIELAAQRGQRLVSIPMDKDGLRLDALEAACRRFQPRLLYLIPTYHNPTGSVLSSERRQRLLQLAEAYNLLILEDDIYGSLAYDGPAPPALKAGDQQQHVCYMLSFSKILLPGLRLCAMVVPPALMTPLLGTKRSSDLLSSPLLQSALADYLRRQHLAAHLHHMRGLYRERRNAMLAALEQYLPDCHWRRPEGGLSFWITLPAMLDERTLYLAAIKEGIGIAPGSAFYVLPPSQPHMRLSFSTLAPLQIHEGVKRLGSLIQALTQCRPSA